jgi:hypothetical protein
MVMHALLLLLLDRVVQIRDASWLGLPSTRYLEHDTGIHMILPYIVIYLP